MYQVPATRSSVVQFVMTCPGMSHSSTFTLHMRDNGEVDDGKVWGDLCREKRVDITYSNERADGFEVDDATGKMVMKPYFMRKGIRDHISWDVETLDSFFKIHNIVPNWINEKGNRGKYNYETGKWTGSIGRVIYLAH